MKTIYNLTGALCLAFLLFTMQACNTSCVEGSGKEATESRNIDSFEKLDVAGGFKVVLVQDSSNKVTITGDDNIIKLIKTENSGDKLKILTGRKSICAKTPVVITIGVRKLKEISASGAVELSSNGKLNVGDLDFHLSGASKINLDVTAANINTEGSGITNLTLKGQASSHSVQFSGSGRLHAFDMVVSKYAIEATGESNCEVNVLNDLSVHATGACEVKYKGSPAKISKSETGSLTVTKVE